VPARPSGKDNLDLTFKVWKVKKVLFQEVDCSEYVEEENS